MAKTIQISFLVFIALVMLNACSNNQSNKSENKSKQTTIKLIAYDSFPTKDTGINDALDEFTKDTGIKVEVLNAGDAGTMLAKAELTAGNPEGDVMFGVDNTLISRAEKSKVYLSYKAAGLDNIDDQFTTLSKDNQATPVDYGDVCLNYDIKYFDEHNLDVPASLDDLTKPEYKAMLVTQDPSSSSPGLAFMLSTIDHFGENGWEKYWEDLKKNDVKVVDSWDSAYYEQFSGSSGKGQYPLVVSYASSPVAEVVYSDPPTDIAPTGNIDTTCFRQVEFVGILRGTKHEEQAQRLIDYLISDDFQKEVPLSIFVYPVNKNTQLPTEFTKFSSTPSKTFSIPPDEISEERQNWIDSWTQIVLK